MAALAGNYDANDKPGEIQAYNVKAAKTIYQGALVCADAGGLLVPAADTAGLNFVGVAYEPAYNAAGADSAIACRVKKRGSFVYTFTGGATSQALIGTKVYAADDNTVSSTGAPASHVLVGTVVALVGSAQVRVFIDNAVA